MKHISVVCKEKLTTCSLVYENSTWWKKNEVNLDHERLNGIIWSTGKTCKKRIGNCQWKYLVIMLLCVKNGIQF